MPLSRVWLFLVALVATVAAALVLIEPRSLQRELDAQADGRLAVAAGAVDGLLRASARRWLEVAAQATDDAVLAGALAEVEHTPAPNLELLHQTALGRLDAFQQSWRADGIVAVDGKGVALARVGRDAATWKDSLADRPLVAAALAGKRSDGVTVEGGKLYRVIAAPIVVGDRKVGALVVSHEIGEAVAAELRETLGVDIAFVADGQVVGLAGDATLRGALPRLVADQTATLGADKRTEPLPVEAGDRGWGVLLAPLAGATEPGRIAVALAAEHPDVRTPLGALRALRLERLSPRELAIASGALVAVLLVGYGLMAWERGRGSKRLVAALERVASGESSTVDAASFRGRERELAEAMERVIAAEKARVPPPPPVEPRKPQYTPAVPLEAIGRIDPDKTPLPAPIAAQADFHRPLVRRGAIVEETPATRPELRRMSDQIATTDPDLARQPLPTLRDLEPSPDAPLDAADTEKTTPGEDETLDSGASARVRLVRPPPEPMPLPDPSSPDRHVDASGPIFDEGETTEVNPTARIAPALDDRKLFDEYLALRRRLGEPTENASFERFADKLRANRETLVARYRCRGVRFEVAERQGRAALKATPIF